MRYKGWVLATGLFIASATGGAAVAPKGAAGMDVSAAPATAPSPAQRMSLDFQVIDTRALLQLIAQNAGLNFVISDGVKGNMTLHLKEVTWRQALEVVLKANGLGYRRLGGTWLIAPVDELAKNEVKALQAKQQVADLAPLQSEIIPLTYANATELAAILKGQQSSLLSPRGQLGVDTRTNSLWVRDIVANLGEARRFIKTLDVPARQVLIEARIVSVDTTYEKDLGVRFGLSNASHLSGTLTGANDLAKGTGLPDVPIKDRLNFNGPAGSLPTLGGTPGSIGLAVFRLGHVFLDLELSALEGEKRLEIISNPRVITSNQQKAVIQTGEEIPYQESTSSGATSISFKKAVLSLAITPQITPDDKIVLNLLVTQNKRGTSVKLANNTEIPAIDTQEVSSQVFLNDGETVVLGGVYKQTTANTVIRIPFLGSLPVVGALFRQKSEARLRNELLVFITPRIIKPLHTARAGAAAKRGSAGEHQEKQKLTGGEA